MTEEINGYLINISDCKYFEGIGNCKITENLCVHNKTCYFKEIARLKQENEAYKSSIIANLDRKISERYRELLDENEILKQENEKLKDANKSLSMLGTDLASANEVVRKEFFRADKNKDMWRECAENYRSALEEIREIAKVNAITTCWSVLNCCDECKDDCEDQSPFIKLKEIVDKINEVLEKK